MRDTTTAPWARARFTEDSAAGNDHVGSGRGIGIRVDYVNGKGIHRGTRCHVATSGLHRRKHRAAGLVDFHGLRTTTGSRTGNRQAEYLVVARVGQVEGQ